MRAITAAHCGQVNKTTSHAIFHLSTNSALDHQSFVYANTGGTCQQKEHTMTFGLVFWILMLIWLIFGIWRDWPNHFAVGGNLLQFILFLLLGWKVFGPPIHG